MEYEAPKRRVLLPADVEKWEKSKAYQDILAFVTRLNESVRGKSYNAACPQSDGVRNVVAVLDTMASWIEEYPPVDQPQRYGNKVFRSYYARLQEEAEGLTRGVLKGNAAAASVEACVYLVESVGNSTRIDYGTGHEFAFVMYLVCLSKLGLFEVGDAEALVTIVFKRYLELVRLIQTTYRMEPAGSQGVWSLDDYQFVPFIWGSAQLMMHPRISPDMMTQENVVEEYHEKFMLLGCIKYTLNIKTGPFAEHSNQLWNISGVKSWTKINQGLLKMYKAEVLSKYPVMQHVLFGKLLSFEPAQGTRVSAPIFVAPSPPVVALPPGPTVIAPPTSVIVPPPTVLSPPTPVVDPPILGPPLV